MSRRVYTLCCVALLGLFIVGCNFDSEEEDLGRHTISLPTDDGEFEDTVRIDLDHLDFDSRKVFSIDHGLVNEAAGDSNEVTVLFLGKLRAYGPDDPPRVLTTADFHLDEDQELTDDLVVYDTRDVDVLHIKVESSGPVEATFDVSVRPNRD